MNSTSAPNVPTWQIQISHPDLVEPLKTALREISDPEIGLNIIQLGLVRDVAINEGAAVLHMILTTPFCPYGPAMIESTREKAESALKIPVSVSYGLEMWDFSMMEEGAGGDWGLF
jgi:metal-sulfur cluster biosynthetic enzyme